MNVFRIVAAFALFSVGSADAQLPESSKNLTDKLLLFEKQRLEQAHNDIATKRAKVIELLIAHQTQETKAGNLDGALAIKAKVEELSALQQGEASPATQSESAPDQAAEVDETKILSDVAAFTKWVETVEFEVSSADIVFWIKDGNFYQRFAGKEVRQRQNIDLTIEAGKIRWSDTNIVRTITVESSTTASISTSKIANEREVIVRKRGASKGTE